MNVPEIVTEQFIKKLEAGVVPWQRPWNIATGIPKNLISKKSYNGINVLMLSCNEFQSPWWVSFKQCDQLGGSIKKGEHGSMITFCKPMRGKVETENGDVVSEGKRYLLLRYYRVWNVEQTEGLEEKIPKVETIEFNPIERCEEVFNGMPLRPEVKYNGSRAYYDFRNDHIGMPSKELFHSPEEYYSTLFHEAVHSTGHQSRIGREFGKGFGTEVYSFEELIAEIGSAFLYAYCGIEKTFDNSAAYLASWLKKLKEDSRMIIRAASASQKAYNFILNMKETTE
jgi:antirestriction protein ArdC